MTTNQVWFNTRTRSTPYSDRIEALGVHLYSVYNHMLLPLAYRLAYRSVTEDYWHLEEHVQLWDVSVQRQVEVVGPDAHRSVQLMTPRDLGSVAVGRCPSSSSTATRISSGDPHSNGSPRADSIVASVGVFIDADALPMCRSPWPILDGDRRVGTVTSVAVSPSFGCGVAIGMVDASHWDPGTDVVVAAPDGHHDASVCALPFTEPSTASWSAARRPQPA